MTPLTSQQIELLTKFIDQNGLHLPALMRFAMDAGIEYVLADAFAFGYIAHARKTRKHA